MNNSYKSVPLPAPSHVDGLESRVALALTARLNERAAELPHDISERLRFARERALATAVHQRRLATQAAAATTVVAQGRSAALAGPPTVWWRLASALPLVMLLAGLVLIQHHHDTEQITVAAEIDSALLSDALPPDAYQDPGFAEYLRSADLP